MSYYAVHFTGYYPVGAVAVVQASDRVEAVQKFLAELQASEPMLYEQNKACVAAIDARLLKFSTKPCHILLNGDY